MADGLFRRVRLLLDKRSAEKVKEDTQAALRDGTDPKVPERNLERVKGSMDRVRQTAIRLGTALVAAFTVRAIGGFLRQSFQAAEALRTSRVQLAQALRNEGIEWERVEGHLKSYTAALWESHRLTEGEVNPALQQLITITGDYEGSLRGVGLAADLAAATGMDLSSATRLVGRVMNGETTALRRYGIEIAEGADAVEVLTEKLGGMALAATPATVSLTKAWGDLKEAIGEALIVGGDTDSILGQLTNTIRRLTETINENQGNFRQWGRELIRGLRDILTLIGVMVGVRGLMGLRAAFIAAAGGVNVLIGSLRALQVAIGPAGWLTLGISGVIVMFNRMRDSARDAARAADEAIRRRESAMGSDDPEAVRAALIEAQQQLARSREIAREMRANRRQLAQSFKDQMADEAAVVDALSKRYTDLITTRQEALTTRPTGTGGTGGTPGDTRDPVQIMRPQIGGIVTQTAREIEREIWAALAPPLMGPVKAHWSSVGEEMVDAFDSAAWEMERRANSVAFDMERAFSGFFVAVAEGFGGTRTIMEGFAEGAKGVGLAVIGALAEGQAEYHTAQGVAKLAEGTWPPNPAAIAASVQHFAAAGLFRALPGIASGLAGGGGGSASLGGARAPDRMASQTERSGPDINIYLDGVDPSNPRHQALVGQTSSLWQERTGGTIRLTTRR